MRGYNLNPKFRHPFEVAPQEDQIKKALKEAGYIYDVKKRHTCVATSVLYRIYCEYDARHPICDENQEEVSRLNRTQFGVALRQVFPHLQPHHRVRSTIDGKRVMAYRGFVGPESRSLRLDPGRPPTLNITDDDLEAF